MAAFQLTEAARTYEATKKGVGMRTNTACVVVYIGCTRSIGSTMAVEAFARAARGSGITVTYQPGQGSVLFAKYEVDVVRETWFIEFPTNPPCWTQVDILEKGHVPILLSLAQEKYAYTAVSETRTHQLTSIGSTGERGAGI